MTAGNQDSPSPVNPDLRPPGTLPPPGADDTESFLWLWISLAAVLVLGLAVVLVLPRFVGSPQQSQAVPGPVPVVPASQAASADANQAMQAYLQLRARLELENVARWGEPEWSRAAETAGKAAGFLSQRNFDVAAQNYTRALEMLEQLENGRAARLEAAMDAGEQALAANAIAEAITQFELALALQPANEAATLGLARAGVREKVMHFMLEGERAETGGDLPAALAAYQQAMQLDTGYQPAASAFSRVSEQLAGLAFRDAMTRALTALDAGQLNTAGKALAEADKLQPGDVAVADAQRRLARTRHQLRLSSLRRQADQQVESENWNAAVDLYNKALAVDSSAGFARDGLALASARLKLNAQFDHYLEKPGRIYSPQPLANARQLLTAASSAPAAEPKLAGKIKALQQLVVQAGTPVPVMLHSDGKTEVAIYRVSRLGQFVDHRMELLPGSYTVVGTRAGYRDVRKVLAVRPGNSQVSLQVSCEELI